MDLGARLAVAGAELLEQTLERLDHIAPQPQDDAQSSYAPILKKEDGHVDWSSSSREILNRIRGFTPWPGCYGFLRGLSGTRLHVWKARPAGADLPPGALRAERRRLFAGCGGGSIEFLEVQLEGKKRMNAASFLNGFSIQADEVLA